MQDAVAQSFRFGCGQFTVQAEVLEPGNEVDGDRGGDAPSNNSYRVRPSGGRSWATVLDYKPVALSLQRLIA